MFFHSFRIGWRVLSEIITMKTTDVRINDPIPHIIIIEPKKRSNTRPLFNIETAILTSKVHKSFKNWWTISDQRSKTGIPAIPYTYGQVGILSQHGRSVICSALRVRRYGLSTDPMICGIGARLPG